MQPLDAPVLGGRPFTRGTALEAGVSPRQLRTAVTTGDVRRLLTGVYVDAGTSDDVALRAEAVGLVLPDGAAAARRTAAWLYGVDARNPGRHREAPPLECVVPIGRQPCRRPGLRCYTSDVRAADVVIVGAVPTTTPTRTAVDLMRWTAPFIGLAAADAMSRQGLTTADEVQTEVERWRGDRGVATARYLAGLIEPGTESNGESWLRLRIVDAGLPRPQVQIDVVSATGRALYRLDLGWRERRKAVEYDGEEYHSTAAQQEHDLARRRMIRDVYGWEVLVVDKAWVLGRSMALEHAVGAMIGVAPTIGRRMW